MGSALSGDEPYQAFTGLPGLELSHWPASKRTSANLPQAGVTKNMEAGLLIRGGTAPVRAADHVDALRVSGHLARLD